MFQEAIINPPLIVKHLLIPPEQLGVDRWHPGDYAAYELKTNTESGRVSFYIAAQDSGGSQRHWLRTDGLSQFNGTKIELWRLLNENSLRLGSEKDAFFFAGGVFLFPLFPAKFLPYRVLLEDIGDEIVETSIGKFKCQHYFARVRSPSGNLEPLLELWANPSVRPLGIVRARWRNETLDLVEVKTPLPVEIPQALSATFDQKRIRDQGCTPCHREEIGGKDLKFLSKYLLSGVELNLTQCLFHYRQTKLVKMSEPIRLQLILKSSASRELVQFTWGKGKFWIKPDWGGRLVFSLDEIAHQGNIRVQPRTGVLVLNLRER